MNQLFEIPPNWSWKKLSEITKCIQRGKSPKYSDEETEMVVINQKCIRWNSLDISYARNIATDQMKSWNTERILKKGDLLWNSTGTGTIGRACIFKGINNPKQYVVDSHVTIVRTDDQLLPEYLFYWIYSPFVQNNFDDLQTGSTNQVELSRKAVLEVKIPIPSISIQKEIIEKINLLFGEIDKGVEKLKFFKHTLSLYKQSVLNAAIRGKLVPQNFNDEPATILLERINFEKKSLGKSVKIKKEKSLCSIDENEVPFELPRGWKWARVSDISEKVTVGYVGKMKNEYCKKGIPFLRSQNVRPMKFDPEGLKYISLEFHDAIKKSKLNSGDVVVVRSGSVGDACVIPEVLNEANCSDLVVIKQPKIVPYYLALYLNGGAKSQINDGKVGVALTHFNTQSVANLMIPIPPIAEQNKIVKQAKECLDLVEQFSKDLSDLLNSAFTLKQSILKRAFEGKLI